MSDSDRRDVVAWACATAVPLSSSAPEVAAPALANFLAEFPQARLVAAGESTHGTHEFFELKHAMARAMASRRLDAVLFEANLPDSLDVDGWVRTGAGDVRTALAGMGFWTWDTEEVATLLGWLRRDGGATRFLGVDLQSPMRAVTRLSALIDPTTWAATAAPLTHLARESYALAASRDKRLLNELERSIDALAASPLPTAPEAALEARMLIEHVRAWIRFARFDDIWQQRACRDETMAQLARAWSESLGPDAHCLLWAHNQHVARDGFSGRFPSMGGHLDATLGSRYLPIGLMFGSGAFQATDEDGSLVDHRVGEPDPDLVESVLVEVPHDIYALDLRSAPTAVRRWFRRGHPTRSIGSGFRSDREHRLVLDLTHEYDAVVMVRHTSPAQRTPSGRRFPRVTASPCHPTSPLLLRDDLGGPPRGWSLLRPTDGLSWRTIVVRDDDDLALLVMREAAAYDRAGVVLTRSLSPESLAGRTLSWRATLTTEVTTAPNSAIFAVAVAADGRETAMLVDVWTADQSVTIDIPRDAVDVRIGVRITGSDPVLVHGMTLDVV